MRPCGAFKVSPVVLKMAARCSEVRIKSSHLTQLAYNTRFFYLRRKERPCGAFKVSHVVLKMAALTPRSGQVKSLDTTYNTRFFT
ncbi:hypothetical protein RRG08_062845 [Elysia crispata]|uniref:Uncharacterized protein n=1 Tax=Elysia crispata TaxID=231223 RepID=A0AAE1DCU7_9GAST|nr:hypothetical protein RRG08_062845 [Elysia crispata]